ncbi:SDR family oxidoreductase [Alphaproteobacteria bacterium]|nr:SDR family oxidoreductase [Alphaproteobacteria bacterium]
MAKNLLLIGGSGGIGRALAARASNEGWQVTVMDLAASLEAHPPAAGIASIPVDLRDAASVEQAFEAVGDLQGFVNLAGFMKGLNPLEQTSVEDLDDIMGCNFRGAYLAALQALPRLRKGKGAMVNIVSGLAANIRPGYGIYAASKAALVNLTKTLALEAAPDVRVNAVGPAAVDTAFLRGGTGRSNEDEESTLNVDQYVNFTPLARLAVADDIVGPILFLLGDDSSFMTGQTLWVNGGGYMP